MAAIMSVFLDVEICVTGFLSEISFIRKHILINYISFFNRLVDKASRTSKMFFLSYMEFLFENVILDLQLTSL